MNYEQAEEDIKVKLNSLELAGVLVDVMPESQKAYIKPNANAQVWVCYNGDEYAPPEGNGTIVQDGTISFEVVLQARKIRGANGIYQLFAAIQQLLLGFEPTDCGKLYLNKKELLKLDENIWEYRILFSSKTVAVESEGVYEDIILNQITVGDVVITAGSGPGSGEPVQILKPDGNGGYIVIATLEPGSQFVITSGFSFGFRIVD
jgi:hypothetical protein